MESLLKASLRNPFSMNIDTIRIPSGHVGIQVLGLTKAATLEEIKKAYHKLALKYVESSVHVALHEYHSTR